MHLRHGAADTAIVVIVCLAAMFLHPLAHGPYSAVHGPATALRARYRNWITLAAIALAAVRTAARITMRRISLAVTACAAAAMLIFARAEPCPLRC